jgi:ketosteroid isomerase-like protein
MVDGHATVLDLKVKNAVTVSVDDRQPPNEGSHRMSTQDVVTTYLERLGAQDADGVGALFAEEIDWYVPGKDEIPWSGARTRREHVAEYLQTMWPAFEPGLSSAEIDAIVIDGNAAAIFGTFAHTFRHNGRSFRTPVAMHLQVRDGEIVRMHLFEDTAAVAHAYFG